MLARFFENKVGLIGFLIIVTCALVAIFAPLLAPHDPLAIDISLQGMEPSEAYPFGNDEFGRDILSRVIYGARISLSISLFSVLFSLVLGVCLGAAAGFYGRGLDNVIMRVMDATMAFPAILLAISIIAVLGSNMFNVVIALGIVYVPRFARIIRGSVISLKTREFVEAAVSLGASDFAIIFRLILPNCLAPLIVQATYICAAAMLSEAVLSFIGAGTPPTTPSWGNIMAEGRMLWQVKFFIVLFPAMFLSVTVLAVNLLGDGLRDALDPRMVREI